jgi:hypothetical protein
VDFTTNKDSELSVLLETLITTLPKPESRGRHQFSQFLPLDFTPNKDSELSVLCETFITTLPKPE